MSGTYDSNEEHEITDLYTRRATRSWDQIEAEYQPAVLVTVNGQPKLTVYERDATVQPQTYRAEAYDRAFAHSSRWQAGQLCH